MSQTFPAQIGLGAPARLRMLAAGRTLAAALLATALFMTLSPFPTTYADVPLIDGNPVNKYGYSALAALALLGHLLFADRKVGASLLRPAWLFLAAWILLSAVNSIWPDLAFRAGLFTLAAMVAATGVLVLPPNAKSFRLVLAVSVLAVLAISYYGVFLYPEAGVHQGFEIESEHAGLWRGVFSHKNVAGQVMAAFTFIGLYLWRSGDRALGMVIVILSAIFVYETGSKTTLALMPAVIFVVLSWRVFGPRWLPVAGCLAAFVVLGLMTLGSVLSEPLNAVLQTVLPGTTFTGRTDLWRFTLELMAPRQWTGFGIESFWPSPIVMTAEPPYELSWDPRGIVNAHNSYLDLAIALGWPGMAFAIVVLLVLPLGDYLRCRESVDNRLAADLFLMILAFMLLNGFLESFLFERGNPGFMLTWLAVVGLRLMARHRMAP